MNLLEKVKSSGLDIFINYHPKVIDFKRQAKELHKKIKKEKTLMQCQEMIAKENNFNNWHHFMSIIKKYYQKDLESHFLVTKEVINNSENLLLGHDINFNNYKWQEPAALRLHQFILTPNYQEYNVFLMTQIIKNNKKLIVINPNKETLNKIIQNAIKNNREKDLRLFNLSNDDNYKKYNYYMNNDIDLGSGALTELLLSTYQTNNQEYKMGMISFLSSVSMLLYYLRIEKKMVLDFASIKKYANLENIIEMYHSDMGKYYHIKSALKNYLFSLPQFDESKSKQSDTTLEAHGWAQMNLIKIINDLENTSLYSENGVQWSSLCMNEEADINIFYFGENINATQKENIDKLIINLIKYTVTAKLNTKTYSSRENMGEKYLFLLDCYLPKAVAIMPSQARATGLCINFSYSDLKTFHDKIDEDQIPFLLDNTATKIMSHENRVAISSLDNLIKIEAEEKTLIKKNNGEKFLWITRGEQSHQINFDIN